MNRKVLLLAFMACVIALFTSCTSDSDSDDPQRPTIEPPYLPMFEFGKDGVPYRLGYPQMPAEMQALLKTEYVGYVWTRMQTNEIYADGHVCPNEYYDENKTHPVGISVFSEDDVIWYVKTYDPKILGQTRESPRYRVWSIYYLGGKWYLDCVAPIAERVDSKGITHTVWGTFHYVREPRTEIYY